MPDTFQIYQSTLTGPELDEALQNIGQVQQAVETTAQNAAATAQDAQTAETYGTIVQQNQQAIQEVADNLAAVQGAAQNALSAQSAAASAAASAQEAEQWAGQAQQISQGALGWYATPQALRSAHPTGQNGQWAIVGTTDTIWVWDGDTYGWADSGAQMDLSQYYTKTEADARFGTVQQVQQAQTAADEATSRSFTATFLASGWQQYSFGFAQTVYCAGMTSDVTPLPPAVQTTGNADMDKARLAALGCIQAIQTMNGYVQGVCYDVKPETDVTVYLTEVR